MADGPDDRPPGEPPAAAPTKGRTRAGRSFGRRAAAAPPLKLDGAKSDIAPPAGRRRIRTLTFGLGAAGAAALVAYAAHQQSQRRTCEAEIQAAIQAGQPAPNCRPAAAHGSGGSHFTTYSSWHWISRSLSGASSSSSHTSTPATASTHGFSFGGFGSHGSAHGGGS